MTTAGARRCEDHVDALFSGLEEIPALILAVSGGPDSMALLHLAAKWQSGRPTPALHVATVDHGLRPEAAAEAALVAAACDRLGFAHQTLVWGAPKPRTRIQERARAARYALLADHARAVGAHAVLTAHHADDQAETVLMRLGRGSGLAGLAGMRRVTTLVSGVDLVRPLLEIGKAELLAVCRRAGQAVCDDPSNRDLAYARTRLRAGKAEAEALGLDTPALCRLAGRMARAETALDAAARRLERDLAPTIRSGVWTADPTRIGDAAPEVLQRVLRRAIHAVCGPRDIRLDRLEALADALHGGLGAGRPMRMTLAGSRIALTHDGRISIAPEAPRRRGTRRADERGADPPAVALRPN